MRQTILFLFLTNVALGSSSWTEHFVSEGCGNTQAMARHYAKEEAKRTATLYERNCEGIFSTRFTNGDCTADHADTTCRVNCTVDGTAICHIP